MLVVDSWGRGLNRAGRRYMEIPEILKADMLQGVGKSMGPTPG
jgi:hypothetical protein